MHVVIIVGGDKMATRPIYISTGNINNPFMEDNINFQWVPGYSYVNKCRRRDSLKREIAKKYDIEKWIEISSISDKDIGKKLSALNLMITLTNDNKYSVETIYQNSKIYKDNAIVGFKFRNTEFENNPYGMYYDYIYMVALYQNKEYHELIKNYYFFTDLFFNPNKSLNTQARAIAIFKTLYDNDYLKLLEDVSEFKKYYKENVKLKIKKY